MTDLNNFSITNIFTKKRAVFVYALHPGSGRRGTHSTREVFREHKKYRFFTDAALSLANHVADALKQNPETQDKMVAMYAYFITAQPPSIQARNNVMILVATRFNIICWRLLVKLWGKKPST